MKKNYVWIIIVVLIAAGGVAWYASSQKSKNSNNSMSNMNMSGSSTNATSSSSNNVTATDAVTILNYAFKPANISVKAGTTVTWTNKDSVAHTVTESDGKTGPNSGDVNPGSTYSYTFKSPGVYHYHCAIHLEMIGTVTVTS